MVALVVMLASVALKQEGPAAGLHKLTLSD
jgi:hypothetical protein